MNHARIQRMINYTNYAVTRKHCLNYSWYLQSEVVEIDRELQTSAANVLVKGEELVQARKVESNIASAIDNLSSCLPVLTTYAKLQLQMKEKR